MNRINRKVEYSLMALKYMSQKFAGQLSSAKEISEATGAPFDATARVMQVMAQQGLLKSEQGAQGGYLIIRDLEKVSIFDLFSMILGPLAVAKCLHGGESCELLGRCQIESPMKNFNHRLQDFYRQLSVAEVLGVREPRGELGA